MREPIKGIMYLIVAVGPAVLGFVTGCYILNSAASHMISIYHSKILPILNQHRFDNDTNLTIGERFTILESHHILSPTEDAKIKTIIDNTSVSTYDFVSGMFTLAVGLVVTVAIIIQLRKSGLLLL